MNEQNFSREVCIWVLVFFAVLFILIPLIKEEAPFWLIIPGIIFLALSWVARALIPKKKENIAENVNLESHDPK